MSFENAYISKSEYEQYDLAEVDKKYVPMSYCDSAWTIDRARNIHMRSVSRTVPPDMGPHDPFWLFWWKTAYVVFETSTLQRATKDNKWRAHKTLTRLEVPPNLQMHIEEIVEDIEAALKVYGTGGVNCIAENYQLRFDVRA